MTERQRRSTRRPRALRIGGLGGVFVALTLLGAAVGFHDAPRAAGEPAAYTAGEGSARANIIQPALVAGNLSVTVVAGEAYSTYLDQSAKVSATSLDLPLLRLASSAHVCNQAGLDTAAALPDPLVVSTAVNGDKKPVSGSSQQPGFQLSASASPGARSEGTTVAAALNVPSVASIDAGRASVSSGSDEETATRSASAQVSLGDVSLLGGIVQITGMRWDLTQTMKGTDSRADQRHASGTFTMGSIRIQLAGLPLITLPIPSAAQLEPVIAQANKLLAPLGVQLRLPTVTTTADGGAASVSPLTVAIGGSKWLLAPVFSTLLNNPSFRQLVDLLTSTLFDAKDCNQLNGLMKVLGTQFNLTWNQLGSTLPLLIAVATGVVGGTGEIQLNLGGVSTSLDDTYYPASDFGAPTIGQPPAGAPASAGDAPSTSGSSDAPATSSATSTPSTAAPAAKAGPATKLASSTACQSTSPAGRPACWAGHAPAAALGVGLFSVGLLVTDEVLRRRSQRLPKRGSR